MLCASLDMADAAERALAILMVVDDNLRGAAPTSRRGSGSWTLERAAAQGAEVLYFQRASRWTN